MLLNHKEHIPMPEFSRKKVQISQELIDFSTAIINGDKPAEKVRENKKLIEQISPSEVIALIDELVLLNIPIPLLKTGVNKLLNLFNESLKNFPPASIKEDSFLDFLTRNNAEMESRLKELRPLIRKINKNKNEIEIKQYLLKGFAELEPFDKHYVIKENVLFPLLEKHWPDHRCLQIMWSFHDDIRRNRKHIISVLKKVELDLPKFNRLAGDLFFNMLAIKFREERIIFPVMLESIPAREIKQLLENSREFRYPFIQPKFKEDNTVVPVKNVRDKISLETGILTAKQIKLIFNHLPVDITFVDEHNKVQYFSTPSKRTFPRAKGIIGRDVKNCHPPESVHIVEEIIEEFRKGNQEKASFWIKMGEVHVLIQYFAVRDKQSRYCGVVEVSQEISEIKQIEGEKRLLDWSK